MGTIFILPPLHHRRHRLVSMCMTLLNIVLADDIRFIVCPRACVCKETPSKLTVDCFDWVKTPVVVADKIDGVELSSATFNVNTPLNVDILFNHTSWRHVTSLAVFTPIRTTTDTFQNFVAVEELLIAHVEMSRWNLNCLSNLYNINSLSLINSSALELNDAVAILRHLGNKTLRFLNLTMTNNWPIGNLPVTYDSLKTLMDLDLEVLDISHVGIFTFNDFDMIDLIDAGYTFRRLKEIYLYDTSFHGYGTVTYDRWKLIPAIRKLFIGGGLSYQIISGDSCDEERRDPCSEYIETATNLTEVMITDTDMLQRCYLRYPCPTWPPNNSLVRISLENTNIERIELELARMARNLEVVNFRHNRLVYLIPTIFKDLQYLRIVRLGENMIGSNHDFPLAELLSFSQNLEDIDFCCNQLRIIPENMFRVNIKLRTIDLSYNEINSLHLSISHLMNIELLNLAGNPLKYIDEHSLTNIISLRSLGKTSFLDLRDNNITCSCGQSSFINQLNDIKGSLIAPETYTCVFDSQFKPLFSIDKEDIEFTCYVPLLKTFIPCFGVIVICTVVSAICYRKRLVFLKLYVRIRFWRYRNRRTNITDRVLVAYSMKDKDFALMMFNRINPVLQHLLQTEEDVLYINDKHFRVPGDIDEEIVRAVRSSRCTIPIVSEDFINSAWTNLEISLSWVEKKPILPVFLSEVKRRDLQGVLGYYYDRKTRLLFPTNAESQEMFWQTLLVGIADVLNIRKELSSLSNTGVITESSWLNGNSLETYV